jgi:hypothetical protein
LEVFESVPVFKDLYGQMVLRRDEMCPEDHHWTPTIPDVHQDNPAPSQSTKTIHQREVVLLENIFNQHVVAKGIYYREKM